MKSLLRTDFDVNRGYGPVLLKFANFNTAYGPCIMAAKNSIWSRTRKGGASVVWFSCLVRWSGSGGAWPRTPIRLCRKHMQEALPGGANPKRLFSRQ
jgi:hypothetical protein